MGVGVVQVDDFLATVDPEFIQLVDPNPAVIYKMSKAGSLDTCLSLTITQSREVEVYLTQQHHIEGMVDKHLLSDSKDTKVP